MKAFKLPTVLSLNKKEELNKKKLHEKRFDTMFKSAFSTKLNEDLSEFIKEELIKKTHTDAYSDLNKSMFRLIKLVYKQINDSIHFNDELKIRYINKNFIPERDVKILYDIIILILKYFPNKAFKLTKYKFSKVRKYFIYSVESEKYRNVQYVIFDYNSYDRDLLLWVYTASNEDDLKKVIKQNFKMINPETKKKQKVSLNRSERSSKFDSKYYSSDSSASASGQGSTSSSVPANSSSTSSSR